MADVYNCEIISNIQLTDEIYSITVQCAEIAAQAKAGQFLHIACGELLLRRPISICSIYDDKVRFVFEVKGEGTKWLTTRKPGEKLSILGPLGNGFKLPVGRVIVVGGGIGAPPLLFAAHSMKNSAAAILGFRDKSRIILKDEFEAVCNSPANINSKVNAVIIATDDGSFGIHGMVTTPLVSLLRDGGYSAVLACGPYSMLKAVAVLCKRYNIPCQVSLEERMGCGVGACLVCVCETVQDGVTNMSRVCSDGPVFDANLVNWL